MNSAQFTSIERDWSVPATFRPMLTPWQPLRDCQYLKPQVRLDPRRTDHGNPLTPGHSVGTGGPQLLARTRAAMVGRHPALINQRRTRAAKPGKLVVYCHERANQGLTAGVGNR